jgi:transcriptional regulator with XRE-family HTH domain
MRSESRNCARCKRPLSRYNSGHYCSSCLISDDRTEDDLLEPEEAARLGDRLRAARLRRGLSLSVVAQLAGVSAPYLSMVENGKRSLDRYSLIRSLAEVLRIPASELVTGFSAARAGGEMPSRAVRDAVPGPAESAIELTERDAVALLAWMTSSNTTDDAIANLDQRRAGLAEAHTREPPGLVLAGVLETHRQVQGLLKGGRQRFAQTRELFRIDAGLLAHASLLLDDIDQSAAARAHGKVAMMCAQEAGISPAKALSAQAKSARWHGVRLGGRAGAGHFTRSADLARRGFECSPESPVRALLAGQEASAAALLGDATRAREALRQARHAASESKAIAATSTWACPGPRLALYEMSVGIRLGDADGVLKAADEADAGWNSGEPWLYGVWSLVRVGAAIAHVMKDDVSAASEQVSDVLALGPAFRITTISSYLDDLDHRLAGRRLAATSSARDLREQIAAFTAAALASDDLEIL